MTTPIDIAREAAMAADDKKASDVVALDVRGISDVVDAIVVCTAANSRLAGAVVDEVEEFGLSALSVSGKGDGPWVLVDFASVSVHVFSPEGRDYYRIERLWGDAPRIDVATDQAHSSEPGQGA